MTDKRDIVSELTKASDDELKTVEKIARRRSGSVVGKIFSSSQNRKDLTVFWFS